MLEALTETYLRWRYNSEGNTTKATEAHGATATASDEPDLSNGASADHTNNVNTPLDHGLTYTVAVYNIYSLADSITVNRVPESISPALDLMRYGYLAKSPSKPTVAVSITTLELLYRLRQRKASFSIEAFAKVVCDVYNVSVFFLCLLSLITTHIDAIPPSFARGVL